MSKINLRYRLGVIAAAFAVLALSIALTETSASANDLADNLASRAGKRQFIQLDAAGAPHLIAAPMAAMQSVVEVKAIAASGNDIYVGGAFDSIGGIAARGIARYNLVSQRWFPLGADLQVNGNGVAGFVATITIVGNDVYVAGSFSGGYNRLNQLVNANCVARWNTASSTWFALGSGVGPQKNGVNGDVTSSVIAGGNLYFAGLFKNAYNSASSIVEANNVASWNPTTNTWTSLGKGIGVESSYEVYDLTVLGDNLYMGGRFPWVIRPDNYTLHVDCIARWNLTSKNWFPLGVDSGHGGTNGCGGDVYALATDGTTLYAGGTFANAHNSGTDQPPASHLARWNGTTWSTLNGNNNLANNGVDNNVTELCFNGGFLYVGGDFANVQNTNGTPTLANHLARWNGTTWSLFGAGATVNGNGVDDEVHAMLIVGGQLYVGGLFTEAYNNTGNTVGVSGLARWTNTVWTNVGAAIKALAAVSAASYAGSGETSTEGIMAAFGTGLATGVQAGNTVPLPTTLLNTTVSVRDAAGTERPAQLFFVSGAQVNFLVPAGTTSGTATVTITSSDGSQSQGTVNVVAYAPGLFTMSANGYGVVAAVALRIKANGVQSYDPVVRYDAPTSSWVAVPIDLGPAGEKVFLSAFGTAFRGRGSAPIAVTIGGAASPYVLAGAQGALVGLDQVNAEIPRSLIGRGEVNVVFTVGSKTANTVKINVK